LRDRESPSRNPLAKMNDEPKDAPEENLDVSTIDNTEAMRQFRDEIRERAKHLPRNCVENNKPHVAAKALWMLAQGGQISTIANITGLGHETIRRLEWQHSDTLETKRKEFSMRYAIAAAEYTDLLFKKAEQLSNDPEQLKVISPDRLALTVGIMTDHASKLMGMATTVVEHRKGTSIADAAKLIEDAKARAANKLRENSVVVEAEIVA
jgi:DNA-binding phage protein